MKRLWPLLCALLGCDRLGPGDAVYLFGAFTDAPAEVAFALERSEAGLQEDAPRFLPFAQVQTNAEGRLAVELTAADLWGNAFDTMGPSRLRLVPLGAHPGLTVSFEMTGDAELPALPLAGLSAELSPTRALSFRLPATPVMPVSAQFANTPESPNPSAPAPLLEVFVGDARAWTEWAPSEGMPLSTVLEDFEAMLSLRAVSISDWTHDPLLAASPSTVRARFEWRTALSVPRGATVPVSREAPCGEGVCPWTDGALQSAPFAPDTLSVELRLREASTPSEVLVRGLQLDGWGERVWIEGLHDGSWVLLAELPVDSAALPWSLTRWPADSAFDEPLRSPRSALYLRGSVTAQAPVTAIRLSALDWQGHPVPLGALQELSVFSRE